MRWKNRQLYKHDTNPKTKKDKLDDYLVERREKKQEKRKQAGPAMLTIFALIVLYLVGAAVFGYSTEPLDRIMDVLE
ncbi:hypothetical protein CHL76_08505 [Marinococcus halophilus]|uniref:Uncharacterized protein n=1 Tax=Marinococcus halophilus TaxID=1371 RepID=A0A510Y6U0_MARHA|nr:hypothetical protein [Marinococcus halophilus]OZT80138.1 hypothetical protein CHL76_08505 [Marinococcus halophilus]GEK58187.1 hypothetical protein MHA01_10920 [Marinococcus halophilus]